VGERNGRSCYAPKRVGAGSDDNLTPTGGFWQMPRLDEKRKGCYHSTLVMESERGGPIPIILSGPVLETRNKDMVGTVYFREPDSDKDRYYNIENRDIRRQLEQAPRSTVLLVSATGHGDDPAGQTLTIAVGHAVSASASAPAPARQQQRDRSYDTGPYGPRGPDISPPAQQQPAGNGNGYVDQRQPSILAQYGDCFAAAWEVIERAQKKFPALQGATPDTLLQCVKEITGTLFIEQNKQAGVRPLRSPKGGDHA
jgi:hypothetical protein